MARDDTPRAIAQSAKALFTTNGYAGTSVRAIASAAGVDPALVIRHFGSKERLFLQVIGIAEYVAPPIDGPVDSLGRRLAEFIFAPEYAEFRSRMAAMFRASDRDTVRRELHLVVHRTFIRSLVRVLPGTDREVRAQLITTQLAGIAQATVPVDELLSQVSRDRLIDLYGRAIQALVDVP